MVKRFSQWKRLLAAFLTLVMLFSNNVGVLEAFAAGEGETNLQLNANLIVHGGGNVVETGDTFQYKLEYTVPEHASEHTGAALIFTLPEYVELVRDSEGKPSITGVDFVSLTYTEQTNKYVMKLISPLPMNEAHSLVMDLKTNNLITPDDLTLDFDKGFKFQAQIDVDGQSQTIDRTVEAGQVITNAASDWQISKENITPNGTKNYLRDGDVFKVTYQVRVEDKYLNTVDRLGRLGFKSYKVIDTLPTNLPDGGEALRVEDVKMIRSRGDVTLTEGTDYNVVTDAADNVTAIEFVTINKIRDGETAQYLAVGDDTDTVYQYTVVYPYAPYTTSGDKPAIINHELKNTATLDYKLFGQEPKTATDTALANIGEYEDNVVQADVSVTKYIQFADRDKELLDKTTADKYDLNAADVKFTLYTDADCTNVAYNTKHASQMEIGINEAGVAVFTNIRKGIYYIKEVSGLAGWTNADKITVEIDDNGNVKYPEGATSFAAINTARDYGVVEFQKVGIDAAGVTNDKLTGATFTLTDKTDSSKIYETTSDAGKVRFNNIPAGKYILEETKVSDTLKDFGYEASEDEFEVTVEGGKITVPDLDEYGIYKNESAMGHLKIVKVDAQNNAQKLSGATFEVYGPYDDKESAEKNESNKKAATLITEADGTVTSKPLEKGFYLLVETSAPINYTAAENTVVEVTEQTTFEKLIENDPQAKVRFTKKGAESATSTKEVQELADAIFEIYNEAGKQLYGKKDSEGNFTDVSTDKTNSDGEIVREEVIITTRLDPTGVSVSNYVALSPGAYKYKETFAPAPFEADKKLVDFTVDAVAPSGDSNVWNTSQTIRVNNYLKYGQIRVVKKADNGATDADALNDITFRIYKTREDAEADQNHVDEITTGIHNNKNGIAYTSEELPLGKYYIKELGKRIEELETPDTKEFKAPDGYFLNEEIKEVELTAGELQAEWECTNKANVSLKLIKVDSQKTDVVLPGVEFSLYTAPNVDSLIEGAKKTTGPDGAVVFSDLELNTTYYYKETGTPEGYQYIPNSEFVEVKTSATEALTTYTVKNDRPATFLLNKKNLAGDAMADVSFKLIKVQDATKNILEDTNNLAGGVSTTTDDSGNASFENLVPGKYWLVETVPEGYITGYANDKPVREGSDWKVVKVGDVEYFYKMVDVIPGQNLTGYREWTEYVTNYPVQGKIKIQKYEAKADGTASATPIEGVEFTVYSDAECTMKVTTLTTDGNGAVTSGYLDVGTYYIKETDVPDGYVGSDTVYQVEVKAGQIATTANGNANLLAIANGKKGSFTINKMAFYEDGNTDIREPLKGAAFQLIDMKDNTTVVATIDMTDKDSAEVEGIAPGTYRLHESVVPGGHTAAPDSLVRVNPDGSVQFAEGTDVANAQWGTATDNVTVDNVPEDVRIRLIKYEYQRPSVPVVGATFAVYMQADNGTEFDVDGEKINLVPVLDKDGNQLILETDEAGQAITPDLAAGHTYYFKELSAPDDYYYDPDDVWQKVEIPADGTGVYRVIFVNYPKDFEAPGIKYGVDGNDTSPLAGAVLAVFDNEADANAMLAILKNNYDEISEALTEAEVRENATAWNIDEIVVSQDDGSFTFTKLTAGGTYYIVEVVAPTGYQMEKVNGNYVYYKVVVSMPYDEDAPFDEVWKGSVRQNNVHTLTITNYAKHQIWLDKKVKLSDKEYWVEGAEFTIYPSKEEDGTLKPDTTKPLGKMDAVVENNKVLPGRFVSVDLPAGVYWLEETKFPDGLTLADRTEVDYTDIPVNGVTHRYYRVDLGIEEDNDDLKTNPIYNKAEKGKFALTKVNKKNEKLQATFTVEKVDDATFAPFEFTTSTSGYKLSDFLAPGLYKLTEKSVTGGGYTISKEPIYIRIAAGKITDGTSYQKEPVGNMSVKVYQPVDTVASTQTGTNDPVLSNSIQVENAPQGKFFVDKTAKSVDGSQPMGGVTFDIYRKSTATSTFEDDKTEANYVKTITTDTEDGDGKVKGTADSGLLDAGNYWVIEVSVPDGMKAEYGKDSYTAQSVTVVAGQQSKVAANTVAVENTSKYGRFQVTKIDSVETSKKISGVTFKIYNSKADAENTAEDLSIGTMTDAGGVYTSPDLLPGKYYLKETGVPSDYDNDNNKDRVFGPFTVNALQVTDGGNITNEHNKKLTVFKYEQLGDDKTTTKINGAEFRLYKTLAAAVAGTDEGAIGKAEPTKEGKVTWNGLTDGTYFVRELSTPKEYLLQDSNGFVATPTNPAANVYQITISGKSTESQTFAYSFNVYNLRLGGFELEKQIKWTGGNEPGKNISFNLYRGSVAEANFIETLPTDESGKISYTDKLPEGNYVLVELDPNNEYDTLKPTTTGVDGNYIDENGNIHIKVLASQTNKVFTGDNAVENVPFFGRFKLMKKTYITNDQKYDMGLNGAEYKLEKYDPENPNAVDGWVQVGTENIQVNDWEYPDGTKKAGEYISGHMEPGTYRVTEVVPPGDVQLSNGEKVSFAIDKEPITFTVTAGTTEEVEHYDSILRNLKVTKTADAKNDNKNLAGVTFALYHAKDDATEGVRAYEEDFSGYLSNPDMIGETQTTGADGVVTFAGLTPGKYLLVETNVPEGYSQKMAIVKVDESTSYLDAVQTYELSNDSHLGRIVIRKERMDGTAITYDPVTQHDFLHAEFKIYAKDNLETALDTVVIGHNGYGKTCLLPIGSYWVVEERAPDGFTKDDRVHTPLKKLVYVSGNQDPGDDFTTVTANNAGVYEDRVIFQNATKTDTNRLDASILKLVRLADENGAFAGDFANDAVASQDSLLLQDVKAQFQITNLTNPSVENKIPFAQFVVTDENVTFKHQYPVENPDGTFRIVEDSFENPTSADFVMNKVTIGKAYNDPSVSNAETVRPVSAKVSVRVGTKTAEWQTVAENVDVNNKAQEVNLPANAVAFKVEYANADVGFTAGDILVDVTFKQRPANDMTIGHVYEVVNQADLFWEDTSVNEKGEHTEIVNGKETSTHQTGNVSDIAAVTFPERNVVMPRLMLTHNVANMPSTGKFYTGGAVDYETVGTVAENSEADLQHPVMSVNLPPYTTLDTAKYSEEEGGNNGIRATLSNGTIIRNYRVTKVTTMVDGEPCEKYVLDFGEDFVLPVGQSIKLEYTANISLSVPETIIHLENNGFIGSAVQLPLTKENPTGMSYVRADESTEGLDPDFDTGLKDLGNTIDGANENLTYLSRPAKVDLARTDSRLIKKYVSVDGETWLTTQVPTVKPGDYYYYKLHFVNGGDPVRRVRIVDILPFDGDTQEFTGAMIMERDTKLPSGSGYEQVELVSVTPQTVENAQFTVYYYVESLDAATNVAARVWHEDNRTIGDLPMLTSSASDGVWGEGWTTSRPADMRQVTAIGVELNYEEGYFLESGKDYYVELKMRAPGYTAEHMIDYADALIANSTAATVTGDVADGTPVTAIDRVSSNIVHTKLYITTGALGDYAFYDNNDNGIQDEGDIPARNIPVTLYRRKATTGMEGEPQWEIYKTTYTDQTTGMYWFDELPCNYMIPGLDQNAEGFDPTNPANYIGNTYFEYQVEFGIPDGYSATIREAGEDRAVDSNITEINRKGVTDPITLDLTVNANGVLEGEINPTIDAGYVKLVNLGDYVWIDYNKNGVQDESEIGLNGVTVKLYKLNSDKDTIDNREPYRITTTDTKDGNDGYYLFKDLPKGYYVVEFDLTSVDKHTGYTTQYAFTVNDAGSNGADSDAAFVKNENDQIMYTEVIHLTRDDMTWDAGVTVYSALGGFVFDDQDYNDTQSIPTEVDEETTANGIPLPGTVVTLYKVNEDGTMDPEPIGQQTVGEDGRYFFDKLDAGRYKVHFDYPDKYIGVEEGVGDYLHDSETKFFDDSTLNSGFTDIIELPEDTADLTHDAGAYLVSSIGDYVWEDLDRDGIQDKDEMPVKDITVTLQQKLGDGEWTTIETTVTDKNGLYLFEGLKSSDHYDVQYRVAFAIPLNVELTTDNAGDDRAVDSNALPELDVDYGYFTSEVKPPYGKDDLTIDAGLYYKDGLCEVGDYVWYDDNKDGIQDANEKGVEGIEVVLERCESDNIWDANAWKVVGTTETDANGKYIFKGLEPGRYRVAFGLEEPWIVTVSRVGDPTLDSDAVRHIGEYYYTSAFFLNEGDSDMTWDAGIYKPTIVIVEPTTEPTTVPTKPVNPSTPITGDNLHIVAWMAILLSSMTMLVILFTKNKKKK